MGLLQYRAVLEEREKGNSLLLDQTMGGASNQTAYLMGSSGEL